MIWFHQYADDTRLYIGTNSSTLAHQVALIESCTQRVHDWLLNNGLHLNPTKSEAIAFFNPRSKSLETLAKSITSISVAGSPIKLQSSIKNLGVYLDSKMSFDKQVSEICKASYFHIRALRHIRSSLTTEACKTIATAIVGSQLDYCNSLLVGTSTSNLARLQLVQNTLARVVTQKSRFSHISPVLSDLHWLPIRHRISFKLATITFKVFGSRGFRSAGPAIWNSLPLSVTTCSTIQTFKKQLKTHLFASAFPSSWIVLNAPLIRWSPLIYLSGCPWFCACLNVCYYYYYY